MKAKNRKSTGAGGKQKEVETRQTDKADRECELRALYGVISTKFSKSITSVEETEEILSAFIADYFELRKHLEIQQSQQAEAKDLNDPTDVLKKKVRRFKAKITELEKRLHNSRDELEKAKENEEKQKNLAENEALKNQRLLSEIECLNKKLEINSYDAPPGQVSQSILILEGLLEEQNKEMISLSNQRDTVLKQFQNCLKMFFMFFLTLGINQYIVYKDNHKFIQVWLTHSIHEIHEYYRCVSQSKWHNFELVVSIPSPKCRLWYTFLPHPQLVIS